MGAKQSKRSVDISGKEAEGGGEVAAAGAGGEGRVEQIADVDALKTQLNGDAHIQHEQTDKEKKLDSGTPENEKDATTEKEEKEGSEKEKEVAPVTNGDAEEKIENGESTPTAEDGKKPKKEKVKKKWSLRSISFSRKDKPKQEKKQKDEEPKTNGEPEKVPEETAETAPEATNEVAEEVKAVAKEETTPETPVTEPLTNGSSTPESAKADTPATEEAAPAPAQSPVADKPEPKPEPEQLPINGLSLEESKTEPAEVEKIEEIKPESPVADIVETAPAPEIPVKEVCVEQMRLLEPTPPPLPANPPPSSVASFAATTMAPELSDTASLPHTADTTATPTLAALPHDLDHTQTEPSNINVTDLVQNDISSTLKTSEAEPEQTTPNDGIPKESDNGVIESGEVISNIIESETAINEQINNLTPERVDVIESKPEPIEVSHEEIKLESDQIGVPEDSQTSEPVVDIPQQIVELKPSPDQEIVEIKTEPAEEIITPKPDQVTDVLEIKAEPENVDIPHEIIDTKTDESVSNEVIDSTPEPMDIPPPSPESPPANDSPLPPPPPIQEDDDIEVLDDIKPVPEDIQQEAEQIIESNHVDEVCNGVNGVTLNTDSDIAAEGDTKTNTQATGVVVNNKSECNGLREESEGAAAGADGEDTAHHTPQETVTISDKLADLIPEVPDVPELKTETLQESGQDVAVAN